MAAKSINQVEGLEEGTTDVDVADVAGGSDMT